MRFSIKIRLILPIVVLLLAISPAYSWDCIEAHPTINLLACENFVARLQAGEFADKFKNQIIDDAASFSGLTFSKAVFFDSRSEAKTINASYTFSGWLAKGGHDADIPQLDMGFRHFYDPYYQPRYLTWMRRHMQIKKKTAFASEEAFFKSLDYRADDWNPNMEFGTKDRKIKLQPKILRPQIDAITWGLVHEENEHNWRQGKIAYKAAMENNTAAFGKLSRSQVFGKAFRALGETMHLLADMTQPAHTRADSHSAYEPIEKTVNEKMIRKIIGDSHKNPEFRPVSEFEIETGLLPADLMKKLATFTNSHFFSNDTVFDYEKWIFPRNNKRPYPSPQLSKLKHDRGIYYAHFEEIGWVPMAKETGSLFSKVLNDNDKFGRKKPHFNVMPNMAEAQAKVLIPLAVFNCAELIKAFLPSFRVEFSLRPKASGVFEAHGELIHEVSEDSDWAEIGAIRFNGPGFLQINDSWQKCEFSDGQLVAVSVNLKPGDKIRLVVRAGALKVFSDYVTIR